MIHGAHCFGLTTTMYVDPFAQTMEDHLITLRFVHIIAVLSIGRY